MDKTLKTIIKNKKTCYFISPHFDDAVLSAGALMSYLSKHTNIVVVNVFTKADAAPYTLSAKTYLKQCGYNNADQLYVEREKEDKTVLTKLGVKSINLGFTDALWRKKKNIPLLARLFPGIAELRNIYPTYRFHITKGKIAAADQITLENITKKLKAHIRDKNAVIFCPLAIGNHIDHVLTRRASEEAFSSVTFWSDFPYNEKAATNRYDNGVFSFARNLADKKKLVQGYVTQYQALFPQGFTPRQEKFYSKNYEK